MMTKDKKDTLQAWARKPHILIAALLVVLVAYNTLILSGIGTTLRERAAEEAELTRPSAISIVALVDGGCSSCYDITEALAALKGANVEVKSESTLQYSTGEGNALVSRYGIRKIPSLVVTGEIDRDQGFESELELRVDALVFEAPAPPYVDAATGQQKGIVDTVLIEKADCVNCFSFRQYITQFSQMGVALGSTQVLDSGDGEAQRLIAEHGIKKLPTLIISSDIAEYSSILEALRASFAPQGDGSYLNKVVSPPYYSLESQSVVGLVTLTLLSDATCPDCYNVSAHKTILPRFGVVVGEEKAFDVSSAEGKALVAAYNISKVPTMMLSGDAQLYAALMSVWPQVGKVAADKSLIFTQTESMGIYKDLSTGATIKNA